MSLFPRAATRGWVAFIAAALLLAALPCAAQEVTVLCNYEVDWCEAMKAAYEKTTGQKAVFIRRTDGESLAQIRAEKRQPARRRLSRRRVRLGEGARGRRPAGGVQVADRVAELHDWAQRIAGENNYFQTPIYTGVLGWGTTPSSSRRTRCPSRNAGRISPTRPTRNEIQMANPGTSGTAFNMVSTILQLMGEDEGFKFLAAMNKNVNQYTRSGAAGIRAAGKGETTIGITFLHDSVAQTVQGYPVKTVAPCEGTGYEIISSAIIKSGPNPEGAKQVDGLRALAGGAERRHHRQQIPGPVQPQRQGSSDGAAGPRM